MAEQIKRKRKATEPQKDNSREEENKHLQLDGERCSGALCGVSVKSSGADELQMPWVGAYL